MGRQILENEELLVEIDAHGGELCRIYDKRRKREVLHDANPAYWNRHAPVLFPMVGASFDKTYRHLGAAYTMGQHGFARDSEFEPVESRNPDQCKIYQLTDSESTRKNYPFSFRLMVGHTLEGRKLTVHWLVENPDSQELLFNIGAHPAFLMGEGAGFGDVTLDLHGSGDLTYYRIEDPGSGCCYVDQPHSLAATDGQVHLDEHFFDEGVYIFQDGLVQDVTMIVRREPVVRVTAPGFPYFGIWSKPGAPFICLEPWHGRTDAYGYTGELSDKEGIIRLAPGAVFETSYEIEIC